MVKLKNLKTGNNANLPILQLSTQPEWYSKEVRTAALGLCATGELPKQALITAGAGRQVVESLFQERDSADNKLILDELYAEVIRCVTRLKEACHKFVLMRHDEHDLNTMKFLLEQDKRRESLINHIQSELAEDAYWSNESNIASDIQYKIISL